MTLLFTMKRTTPNVMDASLESVQSNLNTFLSLPIEIIKIILLHHLFSDDSLLFSCKKIYNLYQNSLNLMLSFKMEFTLQWVTVLSWIDDSIREKIELEKCYSCTFNELIEKLQKDEFPLINEESCMEERNYFSSECNIVWSPNERDEMNSWITVRTEYKGRTLRLGIEYTKRKEKKENIKLLHELIYLKMV